MIKLFWNTHNLNIPDQNNKTDKDIVDHNWGIYHKKYSDKWYNIGGKNHERFYSIKETISRLSDGDLDKIALTISKIPAEKRTIAKIFARLIFKKPSLLVDVMKVFAGV